MKIGKLFLMIVVIGFVGTFLFDIANVSADAACAGKAKGADCKLDVDSKSFTPGTCDANQTCVANGTTMTTPALPGSSSQITNDIIPGTTEAGGLVQCGRPGQNMCTLCDLIRGMNIIIHYLMQLAIGVALLAMAIGGVMYIISAGDSGMVGKAKETMKNAAIGFVIIFAGYLIINTTITYLGAKTDAKGNATFGMSITSWGNFECNARTR
jgi:hypothetical protein